MATTRTNRTTKKAAAQDPNVQAVDFKHDDKNVVLQVVENRIREIEALAAADPELLVPRGPGTMQKELKRLRLRRTSAIKAIQNPPAPKSTASAEELQEAVEAVRDASKAS